MNRPAISKWLAGLALGGFLAGCPGPAPTPTPDGGVALIPTLTIDAPAAGASVALGADADRSVPVSFTVTDFTLKAPGTCAGASACGHVHLLIDDAACNTAGSPYNNAGAASPMSALFARCASAAGDHTVRLELHNDDHSAVTGTEGATISASRAFTTTTGTPGAPSIAITSPQEGAAVALGTDADLSSPVNYTVQNFTLKAPGSCAGAAGCGHVHLLVDGQACNSAGAPYNNAGAAGPTAAKFAACGTPSGAHTLTVELHNDDHSPVENGGAVASSMVRVFACKGTGPCIAVSSPAVGSVVAVGADADKSVPVQYSVANFTLKGPGSCAGAASCGHVHVLVDGTACNSSGAPYNNAGAAGPTAAKLAACANPLGAHVVRVELHNDDHSPVIDGSGRTVAGSSTFTSVGAAEASISITEPKDGAAVSLGADADKSVAVNYQVQNFTLKAPGSCAGAAGCGHVHLLIDQEACNSTGAPYNNAGAAGPTAAKFAACPAAAGRHTVRVELHNDDHSPVKDLGARVIASQVSISTVAPSTDPSIAITSPGHGSVVILGTDTNKSYPVSYAVRNFTLKAPGTCAGAAGCGHVHLLIDDAACNSSGAPYNNAGASGPTPAKFAACGAAAGPHNISVELHNDDHSPVMVGGAAVKSHVSVTACASGAACIGLLSPRSGAKVSVGSDADKSVAVDYLVENFTLKAPGTCGSASACGHVHLQIDGSACNSSGSPYNAAGAVGPTPAKFGACSSAVGSHRVTVELHNDNHSPVTGAAPSASDLVTQ